MRDYSFRRSYKFDMYQLINDNARKRKNIQHPLVNRVIPDNKMFRQLRESQDSYTYSLFLDITIRIPPRATSRNRIWNPLKSFPTSRISEVSRREQPELGRKTHRLRRTSQKASLGTQSLARILGQGERRELLS